MSETEKNLVQVDDLKKYFPVGGGRVLRAVDDVSFAIRKGETLGLVGESGCGKTTVGRTLMRIYEPDGGKVLYDGKDIFALKGRESRELTRRMQIIFQDPYASLNPFFTVREIISEGMNVHGLYKGKEERKARIAELLGMVGLSTDHLNRFPHEFSGGQRQRIGIARALAMDPEFIVCDEPISALDVSIQAQIVNMLIRFQEELGLTYLFIAHDLSMVCHISDRVAVMYIGNIVEYGSNEEIFMHPVHPYTKGLLSAVPVPNPDYEKSHKRIPMQGEVISPIGEVKGCRFASRCPYATEICRNEAPKMKDFGGGHMAACHHAELA